MFGLDFVSKTATHLVKTFEDNVRQGSNSWKSGSVTPA